MLRKLGLMPIAALSLTFVLSGCGAKASSGPSQAEIQQAKTAAKAAAATTGGTTGAGGAPAVAPSAAATQAAGSTAKAAAGRTQGQPDESSRSALPPVTDIN